MSLSPCVLVVDDCQARMLVHYAGSYHSFSEAEAHCGSLALYVEMQRMLLLLVFSTMSIMTEVPWARVGGSSPSGGGGVHVLQLHTHVATNCRIIIQVLTREA